jgi:hypothetical protein
MVVLTFTLSTLSENTKAWEMWVASPALVWLLDSLSQLDNLLVDRHKILTLIKTQWVGNWPVFRIKSRSWPTI